MTTVNIQQVNEAAARLRAVASSTPLQHNLNQSRNFEANIYYKREDLQQVRSYKIRGAYNKLSTLSATKLAKGVICASAGNHAQGVAYSCAVKQIRGVIFMPTTTPKQKIEQVRMFGQHYIEIVLTGDTFDETSAKAKEYGERHDMTFIHPFDDQKVIEGQATVGLELLNQTANSIDYLFLPVGGGGLAAGVSGVFKQLSPTTKIIGVEPAGAPSMSTSIQNGQNTKLQSIDNFVDGASVQKVGELNFALCRTQLDQMTTVPEGKVCQTILDLYNQDAMVVEPAGALTVAALDQFRTQLAGKNVVCLISGGNNDITRTEEIKERALLYSGLKHYFIIRFPQRSGALREFVQEVLLPGDDITHFEYSKKHNRSIAPAVIGIEIANPESLEALTARMVARNFFVEYLNDKPELFQFLV